jgi:hypothetical protein
MVSVHASDGGGPKAQANTPEGILVVLRALYLERIKPKLTLIQMVLGANGWGLIRWGVGAAVIGMHEFNEEWLKAQAHHRENILEVC